MNWSFSFGGAGEGGLDGPGAAGLGEAAVLRGVLAALAGLGGLDAAGAALAERGRQVVERDLLPRLEGRRPELIVGVVGPNNAGKSSLFNALSGRVVSAVRATGGATRRLVGAAAPETVASLLGGGAGALGPFVLVPVASAGAEGGIGLSASADPHALCLSAAPGLDAGLLLVDSPDFDSALAGHRAASAALSVVCDLVVVVVTKGSYLNAQVVDFLLEWLGSGRPWVVVLNQSAGVDAAREQVAELVARVGSPPRAAFHAPHDLAHQEGGRVLAPSPLEGDSDLAKLLRDREGRAELVASARAASFAGLQADLEALVEHLEARAARSRAALDHARDLARRWGSAVAEGILPAAPIVAAFHVVLDRRAGSGHRLVRRGAAGLGEVVAWGPRKLMRLFGRGAPDVRAPLRLAEAEREVMKKEWGDYYEGFARDLGGERRSDVARGLPSDLAVRLHADLGRQAWTVRDSVLSGLDSLPAGLDDFEAACEALIEAECARRGGDAGLQWMSTLAAVGPAALGTVVIVATGGVGADLVTGGAAAATYGFYQRLVEWLGEDLTRAARAAWVQPRSEVLAELLLEACLPQAFPALQDAADAAVSLREALASAEGGASAEGAASAESVADGGDVTDGVTR